MTQAEIIEKLKSRSNRYEIIDGQYVIRKQDFDFDIQQIEESILTPPIDGGTKEEILLDQFKNYGDFVNGDDIRAGFRDNPSYSYDFVMAAMDEYASLRTAQLEAKVKELESSLSKEREARQWIIV